MKVDGLGCVVQSKWRHSQRPGTQAICTACYEVSTPGMPLTTGTSSNSPANPLRNKARPHTLLSLFDTRHGYEDSLRVL